MAEAVVGVLIGKLGEALLSEAAAYGASLLCTEASTLNGLFGEIRRAVGWLEIMKAYLQDVEKFRETNKTTGAFVKKIRGLAFRMEDVVDEFKYKLEDGRHGGFTGKMKKRIQHVSVWRRLARELRDINTEIEDAAKQRNLCGIQAETRIREHHVGQINQTLSFAREEDLVGIEHNANKLKGWLLDNLEETKSKVVTVWGMGGAGKTTLVDHVYMVVKKNFDAAAWVTVSMSYQVEDLLKKVAQGLGISVDVSSMEIRSLGEAIRSHLLGKTYILVLDDVWEKDAWINIMNVFPTNCTSRFILTSRYKEVASLATSSDCMLELELLEESHSWKLFCSITFRNKDDKSCPAELQKLAAQFLQICKGLPLAITCIGHLLFLKEATPSKWKKVYDDLELQSTKHVIPGVDRILKISLEDLSYELKNCVLHCALFPEDYRIKRKTLIMHWITAGFIKENSSRTLEDVAEGYLNELVNRSLLQVVERNEFGVKFCRMHDVIRQLALEKAENECFGKIYDGSVTFLLDLTRHLSVQSTNITSLNQFGARYLRAIHAFTNYIDIDLLKPVLSSSSLLSILDLQGAQIKKLPDVVFSLFNLRFLGLRSTKIEVLPEALGRLVNLEVLDALYTGLLSLPKGLTNLKKLRYLYTGKDLLENGSLGCGTEMPRGIRNLTRLYTLQIVKASLETLSDVAALSELRAFEVCNMKRELSLNLCSAIANMCQLAHLSICASNKNEILPLETLCLPATLSKLQLRMQLENKRMPQILSTWSHLSNLTTLVLAFSKLDDDSFSSLRVLRGLGRLYLYMAYDGMELCLPSRLFPRLIELTINGAPQLNKVKIEEGALVSLVRLWFIECPELKHIPQGTRYLAALEGLYLIDNLQDAVQLRQESVADKCSEEIVEISHIRKVFVRKNMWERMCRVET